MNRKSWQRLTLSILGIICAMVVWQISIDRLASVRPDSVSAFTTLTVNTQYVIAAIIIFMVTGRLIYDWKNSTASEVVTSTEKVIQEITDHTPAPKHFDEEGIP